MFKMIISEFVVELILEYYCLNLLHNNCSSVLSLLEWRGGKVEGGRIRITHSLTRVCYDSGVLKFGIFSIKLLIKFIIYLIYKHTFYRFRGHFLPHSRTLLGHIKLPYSLVQVPKLPTSRTLFTY